MLSYHPFSLLLTALLSASLYLSVLLSLYFCILFPLSLPFLFHKFHFLVCLQANHNMTQYILPKSIRNCKHILKICYKTFHTDFTINPRLILILHIVGISKIKGGYHVRNESFYSETLPGNTICVLLKFSFFLHWGILEWATILECTVSIKKWARIFLWEGFFFFFLQQQQHLKSSLLYRK